jgi:APA family basic amino acid/polyamine antiporter
MPRADQGGQSVAQAEQSGGGVRGGQGSGPRADAGLRRELTLAGLVATAVCTVIGVGINVLTVTIHQETPAIADRVWVAMALGAVPVLLCSFAYGVISTAMPRAGGDYVYISRGLHPFLGFIAGFSKWFGLAAATGVIAFFTVRLLSNTADLAGWETLRRALSTAPGEKTVVPLLAAVGLLGLFWFINVIGVRRYAVVVIAMMILMFSGGLICIGVGLANGHGDFAAAMQATRGQDVAAMMGEVEQEPGGLAAILVGGATLFFAYIGFGTVSQAGGEAREPQKLLPRAFLIATAIIAGYYVLFSYAVFHATPWKYIVYLAQSGQSDISVPLLLGALMPVPVAVYVTAIVALTLASDLPPMLLSVSRLFFAWAQDGIFPRPLATVNRRFGTPHWALTASALVGAGVAAECHYHGFFTAVDTIVVALCFTYMLVGISVISLPRVNPELARRVRFVRSRGGQVALGVAATLTIAGMLTPLLIKDVSDIVGVIREEIAAGTPAPLALVKDLPVSATAFWLLAMIAGSIIFAVMWRKRKRQGWDLRAVFQGLPEGG